MEIQQVIKIAEEFSTTPGARTREDGDWSGEQFREDVLQPAFDKARAGGYRILIDLDGAEGYATSFLEESFGGLARRYGVDEVRAHLRFKSADEPDLLTEIDEYIADAAAVR